MDFYVGVQARRAMSTQTTATFDPLSSSSRTACILVIIAVCCMSCGAYHLGKFNQDKGGPLYQASLWSIPSALCALLIGLCIFFMYD